MKHLPCPGDVFPVAKHGHPQALVEAFKQMAAGHPAL